MSVENDKFSGYHFAWFQVFDSDHTKWRTNLELYEGLYRLNGGTRDVIGVVSCDVTEQVTSSSTCGSKHL